MKEIVVSCVFLLMWGLETNADTFEVLTIPYDKIFPERYGPNGQHGQYGQNGQYGHNYQRPGYPQQQRPGYQQPQRPHYQPNYQQPGTGASSTDWVCRNPSSGDMLIISSDSLPFLNNQNPSKPQFPNLQPNQPSQPVQPLYPESNQGSQIPSKNQNPTNPFLPNINQTPVTTSTTTTTTPAPTPINCNSYPQHPMCGETIILGTTTTRTPETTSNTNGQGIIDIRMRGQYPNTNDEDPDRLVFSD